MSAAPPVPIAALRGARLPSGALVDIALDGDEVLAVVPAGSPLPETDGETLDLSGYLVTAAGAEPHAHLDKALSWDAIQPPFGDLERAIESWHAFAVALDEDETLGRPVQGGHPTGAAGRRLDGERLDALVAAGLRRKLEIRHAIGAFHMRMTGVSRS